MDKYSNFEMADMHLAYGAAGCNGRAVLRFYQDRFPHKRAPHHMIFARKHIMLCESGCFTRATMNRKRMTRRPDNGKNVLRLVSTNLSNRSTNGYFPFHCMKNTVRKRNSFVLSATVSTGAFGITNLDEFCYLVSSTECCRQIICCFGIVHG